MGYKFIIRFVVYIQAFFNLNNFGKIRIWSNIFAAYRFRFQIHQKIEPWNFGFSEQIYNARPLYVSPGQST